MRYLQTLPCKKKGWLTENKTCGFRFVPAKSLFDEFEPSIKVELEPNGTKSTYDSDSLSMPNKRVHDHIYVC